MTSFNKFQMIDEVKKQTHFGKLIVIVEINYIRWMSHGMKLDRDAYKRLEEKDITKDMIDLTIARLEQWPENILLELL